MNKKRLLALSLLILTLCFSCRKEDDTDKLSSNPFPYQEEDAAGVFTVKTSLHSSAYHIYGNKVRRYFIDGSIPGAPLGANVEFVAADVHVPAGLNTFEYEAYHDLDSALRLTFGQEAHFSLNDGPTQIFTAALNGPQPILMTAPTDHPLAPPINVTRETQIKWNVDPANSEGMVVEVNKIDPAHKSRYVRIADDGLLTLNSIWSHLPPNGTFNIGLYRGTHTTVMGSDSKKYVINVISVAFSHEYKTQGI